MFSFDGDFRRRPQQNLGGTSQKQDRVSILRNAQLQRQRREQIRKETSSSIKIQSRIRSFLARVRTKKEERSNFDNHLRVYGLKTENDLEFLLKRMVFFYEFGVDGDRLINLCQFILKNPSILYQKVKEVEWCHRLKRLLNCCMNQIFCQKNSSAIPLRMLETFTSGDSVMKFIQNPYTVQQYLETVFKYMIKMEYFYKIRRLIQEKIPILDDDDNYSSPIGEAILQMLVRPLKLIDLGSEELTEEILQSFTLTILSQEFSEQIKYFIIPELAKRGDFPFVPWINYLAKLHKKYMDYKNSILIDVSSDQEREREIEQFSTFLLYSLLKFDCLIHTHSNDMEIIRNYIIVLASVIDNIKKLPKPQNGVFMSKGYDSSSDEEDVDDDCEDFPMYSEMEMATLRSVLLLVNDVPRVIFLVQRVDLFLQEPDILMNYCQICHALTSNKNAVNECKLPYMLAFKPKFIRTLWYNLTSEAIPKGITNPISLISKGLALSKVEADKFIPILATFCSLFGRLITTLHDGEFTNDNTIAISKIMPFTLQEIVPLSTTLKEMCLGLVELAFPETRANLNDNYRTMLSSLTDNSDKERKALNMINNNVWAHLLKTSVALLRQLHTRDLRINFCPEGHWTAKLLHLPLDKPTDLHISRNRRGLRPFQPIRDFTREDLMDGPPLSTKQIRSITILREIPFVVEFNTRVSIFQGLLAADKLRSQGDLQGFLQGPSIQIMVRRSHLYEDAFDKLSLENEPDIRPRFRVQMKNVVGLEEAGIDGGGVFREFLSELIKSAFDPHRGFFMISKDNMLYPNPYVGKIVEDYQRHYFFIGRMLGKALYENLLVELPLAEFFLTKLAGKHSDVDVHQLASLDPVLHRNLMSLKAYEGDVTDLGLDFTVVCDELGETRVEELKPNGSNITVNSSNRIEYIQLMADFKLNRQIRAQCMAFRQGLANVLPIEWLYMFSNKELQVLISGAEIPVDVEDLKHHTRYSGDFSLEHPTIEMFWKVVQNFSDIQKRQLLKFVTSCSRPPLLGFKDLDPAFCIQNASSTDRLPSASTCMNLLKLPPFDNEDLLREKLIYAIQSGAGFELS
uniref:Ubiquitin-protein ligase E3C n=1 Tax=Culicoides sonorensis TaxID=179676 RepID=A0A336MWB4_CULSO